MIALLDDVTTAKRTLPAMARLRLALVHARAQGHTMGSWRNGSTSCTSCHAILTRDDALGDRPLSRSIWRPCPDAEEAS